MADHEPLGKRLLAVAGVFTAIAFAGGAQAQSMNANSGSFNAGYNRTPGQENRPVDPAIRDANGNLVVVDGVIQTGADQSVFSNAGAGGAIDTFAGVGASGGSTAIGNNLVVVTQGNYNTVIVNSKQTNSGNVSADNALTGGVSNAH
ncbi:MAG: holdfast anchoring protein HfaA [Caulobacterales bacterium]